MAGADLYGAAISFLDGDGGDVFSTVNAAFTGTLVSGSVTASRGGTGVSPRKAVTPATTVEIVPAGARVERVIGIGWVEVDLAFDLKCTVRQKSTPAGKTQLAGRASNVAARAARPIRRREQPHGHRSPATSRRSGARPALSRRSTRFRRPPSKRVPWRGSSSRSPRTWEITRDEPRPDPSGVEPARPRAWSLHGPDEGTPR
jgi:hypothetical protein